MILLYPSEEQAFDTNGQGALSDCISCQVTEERNGAYELQMEYPIDGIHYSEIAQRSILFAKPTPYEDPQPFRVYRITKPLNGRVTVYAQHLSYDLSGIPVSPFTVNSVTGAFSNFKTKAAVENPFTFWTDKTTQAAFSVETPASIRSLLGGSQGSILDVYGGEYEFDRWTVKLWNQRGQDSGVTIRYGKNLTDLQQDENISNVATGVYPYWKSAGEDATLVELPEKIVNAPGTYNFTRVVPLDLSAQFDEQPTVAQLRARAQKYVEDNNVGIPTVSLTVAFQPLDQTEEYKNFALLERVNLCDTVTVEYPELGVSAKAKCIRTVYDVLKGRYARIELGDARANIADTILSQEEEIKKAPTTSFVQQIINASTAAILGANGGSVRFLDTNGDGEPDTLYIADDPDPQKARKVWRFNYEGWGASENGYNGPCKVSATLEEGMYADFITAGTFNGNLIKTGRIESHDGAVYFDLDASEITATKIIGKGNEPGQLIIEDDTGAAFGNVLTYKKGDKILLELFEAFGSLTTLDFNGNNSQRIQAWTAGDQLDILSGDTLLRMNDGEGEFSVFQTIADASNPKSFLHLYSSSLDLSAGSPGTIEFRVNADSKQFEFWINNSKVSYVDSTGFHNA